jgi:RHS repeat-associated protein
VSYGLDPVGNRLSDTSSLSGVSAGTWTFNADDQVSGESYDQNGNVTAADGKTFTYDSENHLMSMSGSTTSATIVYDGDGNRVSKTVGGVTTYYLVDDLNPTGYPQVVDELNSSGAVTRTYTYGLQRIDEQQQISGSWTPSFYGYDGGGNVRQLTNTSGTVTDSYEYDAFGNSFTVSGSTPNEMMYRGEQFDSDLGLYYLRARYYNPLTGRFMSKDLNSGYQYLPITFHKYLYAGADPVNLRDPSGKDFVDAASLILKAQAAVPYINAIGCGVGVGITLGEGELFDGSMKWDKFAGAGFTVYGCVMMFGSPTATAWAWVDSGINVGACAFGLYAAVADEDEYFEHPSERNIRKTEIDWAGGLLGCGISMIGTALSED